MNTAFRGFGVALVCGLGLTIAGCGGGGAIAVPSGAVSGTVKLDGQPLTDAAVLFIDAKVGNVAEGVTGSDGSYTLKYAGAAKIPAGSYKVRVGPKGPEIQPGAPVAGTPPPKLVDSPIPEKYRNPETSGLSAEVKPEPNKFEFNLTKG